MADFKFPTEMVDLPSKGFFYFEETNDSNVYDRRL